MRIGKKQTLLPAAEASFLVVTTPNLIRFLVSCGGFPVNRFRRLLFKFLHFYLRADMRRRGLRQEIRDQE